MILVTSTQRGYTDSELHGPFESVEEGKRKLTDGLDRGHDGDETRYTFYEVSNGETREIGYVLFHDECYVRTQDIREEYFPYNDPR